MFLTRLPCPGWCDHHPGYLMRSLAYFPLLGSCVVGLWAAAMYDAASSLWSPLIAAALSAGGTLWLTGCFHEDGLCDTLDGFGGGCAARFSRGGGDAAGRRGAAATPRGVEGRGRGDAGEETPTVTRPQAAGPSRKSSRSCAIVATAPTRRWRAVSGSSPSARPSRRSTERAARRGRGARPPARDP